MKLSTAILAILTITATSVAAQETAAPTPATSTMKPGCWEVSVEGDATFCIEGPICSGSGAAPAGTNCPKVGDKATAECWDYVPSYADAEGCVAPVDAECKLIETGAWGCVWNTGGGSGSGAGGNEAGSSSASGSGSGGATVAIPVNATSTQAENPEDVQFPKNLKTTTLSADDASSATSASTGPIVGIVAAIAGIVCAVAVVALFRRKQQRREEVMQFADAIHTPPNDGLSNVRTGQAPLTPPLRDSNAFFSKVNV